MRWITTWIACCMVACALNAYAQEWERVSLLAPSDLLNDIKYLPDGRIVAVGHRGCIVLSDDLGESWQSVFSGTAEKLWRVTFVNGTLGWAVGTNATVLRTRDRGETWDSLFIDSDHAMRGVEFLDSLHGWAVGERGDYFRTVNGGESWTGWSEGTLTQEDLLSVAFRDTLHGVAVGGSSRSLPPRIRITEDGGETWRSVTAASNGWLADIEYLGDSTFVAVGRHHMILRSTDDGETWVSNTELFNDTLEAFRDVEFLDSLVGLTVSDAGLLFRTLDGGVTWTDITSGNLRNRALEYIDENTVLSSGNGAAVSNDGGVSWSSASVIHVGDVVATDFLRNNFGWLGLENNTFWKTEDGEHWTLTTSQVATQLISIDFLDEQTGFGVASTDSIYKTIDGGATWQAANFESSQFLHKIEFANAMRGWAVGDLGQIVGTRDGGVTWSLEATSNWGFLIALAVLDENHAWATGAGGVVMRLRDGENWELLNQIAFQDFFDLHFVDSLLGFAVGGNGSVYRTTDGGETWTGQNLPMTTLFSVEFANSLDGWIAGENGNIYSTSDGGETWLRLESNSVHHIKDLWISPTRGWAVGIAGTILRADYVLPANDTRATQPMSYSLSVFPNPFNSTATLNFELPREARTEIILYDVLGREAMKLADDVFTAGAHSLTVNAENLATGVYFAELRTPEYSTTQKLLLLK